MEAGPIVCGKGVARSGKEWPRARLELCEAQGCHVGRYLYLFTPCRCQGGCWREGLVPRDVVLPFPPVQVWQWYRNPATLSPG